MYVSVLIALVLSLDNMQTFICITIPSLLFQYISWLAPKIDSNGMLSVNLISLPQDKLSTHIGSNEGILCIPIMQNVTVSIENLLHLLLPLVDVLKFLFYFSTDIG